MVEINELKKKLANFASELQNRVQNGGWHGMVKDFGFCAPGPQLGPSGFVIELETKGRIIILYDAPKGAEYNIIFDPWLVVDMPQEIIKNYIGMGILHEAEVIGRVFALLDALDEISL